MTRKTLFSLLLLSLMIAACGGNQSAETASPEAITEEFPTDSPEQTSTTAVPTAPGENSSSQAQSGRLGTVAADGLNVRQSADTTSAVLYEAPRGTELQILGETTRGDSLWYQVKATSNQFPQDTGWAFSQYINVSGESNLSTDTPLAAAPSDEQAYRDGYERGYKDGENFQQYGSGYNPDAAYGIGPQNPSPRYNEVYREGFQSGFEDGYNGKTYDARPPG
ncbi:MAG: SH3 domain-containing protein [Leptolyngbya sp. LCM1.Bin17]|nr:MAG: SH3 domain-containing protein [Leptolyngbya sp. LCM1.Bin17]